MKCPQCGGEKTSVTRTTGESRWRVCRRCGCRFRSLEVLVEEGRRAATPHKPLFDRARSGKGRGEDARPARCRIEDLQEARRLGLSLDEDAAEGLGL